MAENNAVPREDLKGILAEMAKDLRAETAAQFEEFLRKTAARFEEMDKKTDKRHFELLEIMRAQSDMILAQNKKIDAQYEYFQKSHSELLTGMDAVMKENEAIRHDHISLGVIQDRHTREVEAIQKHLGLESANGNHSQNAKAKKPLARRKKKSK